MQQLFCRFKQSLHKKSESGILITHRSDSHFKRKERQIMNEIKSSLVAKLRTMANETDIMTVCRAIFCFPMVNDEELTEILNRIFRTCGQNSLDPGQALDVLYAYVQKDEMGEENTVQEQKERFSQVLAYSDMEFLDFVHVHSIRDF